NRILDGQSEGMVVQDNPVVGAVHAIAVVPNSDTVFIGTADGGLWRTDNIRDLYPDWRPMTDDLAAPSVGAIAIHPANPNVIVAGTGRLSNGVWRAEPLGILYSDDGGATWDLRGSYTERDKPSHSEGLAGMPITSVLLPSSPFLNAPNAADEIIVGTLDRRVGGAIERRGGLWRSTDGGETWARLSDPNGTPLAPVLDRVGPTFSKLPQGPVTDLVEVKGGPGADRYVFAAMPGRGIFRSTDLQSWTEVNKGLTTLTQELTDGVDNNKNDRADDRDPEEFAQRVRFAAYGEGAAAVLYAGVIGSSGK